MQMEPSPELFELFSTIHQARNVDELTRILDDIDGGKPAGAEGYTARVQTFSRLRALTQDDAAMGQRLVVGRLLPLCKQGNTDFDTQGDVEVSLHMLREQLAAWIDQYPTAQRVLLRDDVLVELEAALTGTDPSGPCATIAAIGYRTDTVVAALWALVANREADIGDVALATLAFLGVPRGDRDSILDAVHERLHRRCALPLVGALRRLADPQSIPIVRELWVRRRDNADYAEAANQAVRVVTDVADRHYSDVSLQETAWSAVVDLLEAYPKTLRGDIYFGADVAPRCDSPHVISTLLSWLEDNQDDTTGSLYRRYLLLHRLETCVRPAQLGAWTRINDRTALARLRDDASGNTGMPGRFQTQEILLKEVAWDICLRIGSGAAMPDFENSVASEDNLFVRRTIMDDLACFRMPSLPPSVATWITERPMDESAAGESVTFRLAATRLARSAGSRDAWRALSRFGLTMRGQALGQSVEALAEVVVRLAREGDTTVVACTIADVSGDDRVELWQRTAATYAVASLAAADLLPNDTTPRLMVALDDHNRTEYDRGLLVTSLAYLLHGRFESAMVDRLRDWAVEREDWLGWRALEVLAEYDYLPGQLELLRARLGLDERDGVWIASATKTASQWAPMLVGVLYRHDPEAFAPAVISLVDKGDWNSVAQVLHQLQLARQSDHQQTLQRDIILILFDRARREQTQVSGETEIFGALAILAPDEFGLEPWEQHWNAWLPDARVALADALGQASYVSPSARNTAVNHLVILMGDGQYAVRRAAYRGVGHQEPAVLHDLCVSWAKASEADIRRRAAEACVWSDNKAEQDAQPISEVLDMLDADPEPGVRRVATRCREERREREWSSAYLVRILGADEAGAANEHIRAAWPYGQALLHIGDDTCRDQLRAHVVTRQPPAHVRHWLDRIADGIDKRWQSVVRAWPEPWLPWTGTIEEGEGEARLVDGHTIRVAYSVWTHAAATLGDIQTWGGAAWVIPFGTQGFTLRLATGRERLVTVTTNRDGIAQFLGRNLSTR